MESCPEEEAKNFSFKSLNLLYLYGRNGGFVYCSALDR